MLGTAGLTLTALLWELCVRAGFISSGDVAPPSQILVALLELLQREAFWSDLGTTLRASLQGLAVGALIGVPLGVIMGRVRLVELALKPTVEFLRPVPSIALVPLFVLLWGQSTQTVWTIVAFGCVWPMLVQTLYGSRAISPVALDTARVFQIRRTRLIRLVLVPAILPYVMTGLRFTASLSLMIAVSVEIIVGAPGLGQAVMFEQRSLDLPTMFALIVVTGVLGVLIQVVFGRIERVLMRGHASNSAEVA